MAALAAYVDGIGLLVPGIGDCPAGARLLSGETAWVRAATILPAPECLPSAERRRTGTVVRLALAVGLEATSRARADPAATVRTVTRSARCWLRQSGTCRPPAFITPCTTLPPATGELRPARLPPPMRCAPMMRALARDCWRP